MGGSKGKRRCRRGKQQRPRKEEDSQRGKCEGGIESGGWAVKGGGGGGGLTQGSP